MIQRSTQQNTVIQLMWFFQNTWMKFNLNFVYLISVTIKYEPIINIVYDRLDNTFFFILHKI